MLLLLLNLLLLLLQIVISCFYVENIDTFHCQDKIIHICDIYSLLICYSCCDRFTKIVIVDYYDYDFHSNCALQQQQITISVNIKKIYIVLINLGYYII